jgi:hypothetical protein
MKALFRSLLAALVIFGMVTTVAAQTTVTQTTLSTAIAVPTQGVPAQFVQLASATNIVVGTEIFMDQEAMLVTTQGSPTTNYTVQRGYDGTVAAAHAVGAIVYAGPTSGTVGSPFVLQDPPPGTACTLSNQVYSMLIVVGSLGNPYVNGHLWTCSGSRWELAGINPINPSPAATYTLTAAQSGSIWAFDRASGVVYTLPVPAVGLNYRFITTVAQTSGADEVETALVTSTTLFMQGVLNLTAGAGSSGFVGVPTTSVAVKSNATTTGNLIGSDFTCTAINATIWQCDGVIVASGTIATPFVIAN